VEPWRLIITWGAPPTFNMGLDEALLLTADAPPTLRFYSWNPDTLSLGYFQRYADIPGIERAGAVVRRITGGGAIHHVNELTFSFTTGLDDPLYEGPVTASYERVHRAIAVALKSLGVDAGLRGETELASEAEGTGMCFHKSVAQDLVWGSRKGVGSAQRRKNGRVLHHGSIKLGSSPLEGAIAFLKEEVKDLDLRDLADRLLTAFREELGLELEVGVPTVPERELAAVLGERYVSEGFLKRR